MRAQAFYRTVTVDDARLMEELVRRLEAGHMPYCVIGGQGVNAYADPLVSLDLDIVVATSELERVLADLPPNVRVEQFVHSVNLSAADSDLRVQLQLDKRYADFPTRAVRLPVLGTPMQVAAPQDVLSGKVWAASDPTRRASKRQKDLADIARLIERFPELRAQVPASLLARLV